MFHCLEKMWTALIFLSVTSVVSSSSLQQADDDTVFVLTEDGILRGKVATSIWNRTYYSFQAIPYAQPPVGDLRFKSPQPPKPWTGVRDALEQGTHCPQSMFGPNASEDCLYLNVYIPQVGSSELGPKGLSVMVWIHGGGFTMGTGNKNFYGPDHLMNHTAILVTLNYRLGALGFLSMEHPDMTSNAGMKDQVAALRWVKRNIAHFGGNPDDVTVFGESAGGMSVELLLLSPMTEGLFHRAISQSGSAVILGANPNFNGTRTAFRLGEALGHNTTDANDLVKFLRSVPAEDIVKVQLVTVPSSEQSMAGLTSFPSVDAKMQEGPEVFLPDVPEKLLRAGKKHQIPYITGVNSNEMRLTKDDVTQEKLDAYNSNPEVFIPLTLNMNTGTAESRELAAKIKSFYFGNKTIGVDTLQELADLLSDNFMITSIHRSAMLHINYSSSPLYTYLFTYNGTLRLQIDECITKGPGHGDDVAYLFSLGYKPYNPNSEEITVIRHFTNMWVDYAEHGNPSVHESVKWTPATKTNHTYLEIDVDLNLRQDMLKKRMAFWDQVYETYRK